MNNENKAKVVYENLSDISKQIVANFQTILQISNIDALKLICSNSTATMFLLFEPVLQIYGIKRSTELLMKSTIFRTDNYDQPITDKETNRIKEYYNLDIKRI
jgi:hypothetical protein